MLKKVDAVGRISIPAPVRRALGISEGDEVDVSMEDGRMVLVPVGDRCPSCDQPLPNGKRT